jgi:ubiquitin-conjugating enzyme E2 J2
MSICKKRLEKEYKTIQEKPVPNIYVKPDPEDIKKWYFLIHSLEDCDYSGGVYMGVVRAPDNYPSRAPTFTMITPSGRFQPGVTLCTTFSHYHPEQWSPTWTIGTTLIGLVSFMVENGQGVGSISATSAERKKFAKKSISFNYSNNEFKRLFADTFPKANTLVADLKKFNAITIELEKKYAVTAPAPAPAPAPDPTPVAAPSKLPSVETITKKMELNAILWMFIDANLEEKEEERIEFETFCKQLARWATNNDYRPQDYDGKITKKSVHAELKKIKPDQYMKGKCLQGYKMISND